MKELIIYVVIAVCIIALVKKVPYISEYWAKALIGLGKAMGLKNYKFDEAK